MKTSGSYQDTWGVRHFYWKKGHAECLSDWMAGVIACSILQFHLLLPVIFFFQYHHLILSFQRRETWWTLYVAYQNTMLHAGILEEYGLRQILGANTFYFGLQRIGPSFYRSSMIEQQTRGSCSPIGFWLRINKGRS